MSDDGSSCGSHSYVPPSQGRAAYNSLLEGEDPPRLMEEPRSDRHCGGVFPQIQHNDDFYVTVQTKVPLLIIEILHDLL